MVSHHVPALASSQGRMPRIESNLAQGAGRSSNRDFSRFLEQQAELASVA